MGEQSNAERTGSASRRPTRRPTPRKRSAAAGRPPAAGKPAAAGRPATGAARPSAATAPTGIRALVPHTWPGRIVALLLLALVAYAHVCVIHLVFTSIAEPNYYQNPVQEVHADLVDAAADSIKFVAPDNVDDAIDAAREQLTGRTKWANDAIRAEQYWDLNTDYTRLVEAMIQVESGGDEDVDAYGNIMEIDPGSGDPYNMLLNGVPDAGVAGCTPQASIYAGVGILKSTVESYANHMGREADPNSVPDGGMLSQGYNYGYDGWFTYCAANGITEWSLDASLNYQATIGGVGTANHGQKVMDAEQALM
ncbi:MAG: hypothetical protein Q4E12_05190 [Coriobacteriia bacterium]|nr:hypothetical protein [Coriobacteriia bacterium]